MKIVHSIRLRGHWEEITLPDGRIRQSRSFGAPRRQRESERYALQGDAGSSGLAIRLNGELLASPVTQSFHVDLPHELPMRNRIEIDRPAGHPIDEVTLVILDSDDRA